jgi:hypothetical protein
MPDQLDPLDMILAFLEATVLGMKQFSELHWQVRLINLRGEWTSLAVVAGRIVFF